MTAPHPLALVPPAHLCVLVEQLTGEASAARTRMQGLLEQFVRKKHGALAGVVGLFVAATPATATGASRPSGPTGVTPLAAWLAKNSVTLVQLLHDPNKNFDLDALVAAQVIASAADLVALGLTSWAALAAAASAPVSVTPHMLRRALVLERGALGPALGLAVMQAKVQDAWLQDAATALAPRDLRALGLDLGKAFAARPEFLKQARLVHQSRDKAWLGAGTAEEWQMTPDQYATIAGTAQAPAPVARAEKKPRPAPASSAPPGAPSASSASPASSGPWI